jgi:phytol kinase
MNPLFGCAIVLLGLGALIGGVKALQARGSLNAEGSRKLVHMGMGVICLTFPLLFRDVWPVWALAAIASIALAGLRLVPALKHHFGSVLHGVDRVSLGELYFPLGVAAVFTLAHGKAGFFIVPTAILTFADAAGALVGRRYGRRSFATLEGTKTVEGSFAVGFTAFLCTALPLLIAQERIVLALTIGVLIGLFSALVEAVSWRGLDNVFLPLAAFAQLSAYLNLPEIALLERLGTLVVVTFIAFIWRRGKFVDDSARLGGALALFFIWTAGDWRWLAAPVVLLIGYVHLMPRIPGGVDCHNLLAVICVGSSALPWCVMHAFAPDARWIWPYTIGMTAQQGIITLVRFSQGCAHWPRWAWWAMANAQALVLQLLAFWLLDWNHTVSVNRYLSGIAVVMIATTAFAIWEKKLQAPDDLNARWWKQGVTAFAASAAAFVFVSA